MVHTRTFFVNCQYFVNTLFSNVFVTVNKSCCPTPSNRPPYISSAKFLTIASVGGVPRVINCWMCPRSTFFWLALSACRSMVASWFETVFPVASHQYYMYHPMLFCSCFIIWNHLWFQIRKRGRNPISVAHDIVDGRLIFVGVCMRVCITWWLTLQSGSIVAVVCGGLWH